MPILSQNRNKSSLEIAGKRIAVGAILLLLIVNALYFLILSPNGYPFKATAPLDGVLVLKAEALDDQVTVAATTDNRLLLIENGQIRSEQKLEGAVTGLAVSNDHSKIYVGSNDRHVYIYDPKLAAIGNFLVNGVVTGLDASEAGDLEVAYGIGQYSDKFWVGRFDEAGTAHYKAKIGFDVSAVQTSPDGAFFGTADSQVGRLSPEGKEMWRKTLIQPITTLAANDKQDLLAGDERGNVTLVSAKGKALWTNHISAYPITAVNVSSSSTHFYATDKNGTFYILDASGNGVYSANLNAGSIQSVIHSTDKVVQLITSQGNVIYVNVDQALNANSQRVVSIIVIIMSVVLLAAATVALIAAIPAWRKAGLRFIRRLKQSRAAYLLLLPSIILILIFNIAPTLLAIFYSFTNFSLKEPLKLIGLSNFAAIWKDSFFWVGIWNMFLILITSIIKELTMPLLVAELIFWLKNKRMKYWLRTAYVVPSIVPGVVGILLWKMMYEPETGLINQFFSVIGLNGLKHAWLGEESIAIWSVIAAGFPFVSIFAFLIYFGGLIGISRDIYDSASIDGIGVWGRFWKIDVPLIRAQIRLILFFTFIGSIQGFTNIYLFTRGGPGTATYVPGLQMYNQISNASFGYASAIGFILAILVLVGTIINFRYSKQEGE